MKFNRAACLTGVLMVATTFALRADDVRQRFIKQVYEDSDGEKLPYRLLRPAKIDPNIKYPLVVFLHGAGERGQDNDIQLVHGMGDFASDEIMQKYPAFVLAPQCPADRQWVDVPWSDDKHRLPETPSVAMRQTKELVDKLITKLPIDTNRISITGLSMGGFGVWDAIARWPDFFCAAAPICGGGDLETAAKIKHVPVWAFHGDADPAVKVSRSRDMIAALKKVGGDPKYTEYPGGGHDSWSATYRNPEFYKWLFRQNRKLAG